jgi:PTH1 family peptidyl-tRNA hydrolase
LNKGIRLIIGLGNPGSQYEDTRHNAGAWFVERIAQAFQQPLKLEPRHKALVSRLIIHDSELRIAIPQTFMNLSGQSTGSLSQFYKLEPAEILVVHDELDLAPGMARLKHGGGHGGHNGLRDIIEKLGNNRDFARLRIGIGHPGHSSQVTGYVLGKPSRDDRAAIDAAITRSMEILPLLASGEFNKAMNQLHAAKNN